jgi:hypothetical protein
VNVGPTILCNQIEERMEILELVRSSGAFRAKRELSTQPAHRWTSQKRSGNLTLLDCAAIFEMGRDAGR